MCVDVHGERDLSARVEVLQRRLEFDRAPEAFAREFADENRLLADRIAQARHKLPGVALPEELNGLISKICGDHNVAGHRADIVIAHAARAMAAFESREVVTSEDVRAVAIPALAHRARKWVQAENASEQTNYQNSSGYQKPPSGYPEEYPESEPDRVGRRDPGAEKIDYGPVRRLIPRSEFPEAIFEVGQTFKVKELGQSADRMFRQSSGKRSRTQTRQKKGRYVRSTANRLNDDIALDATIRAAAPHQLSRKAENNLAVVIRDEDIREKIRETRTGNFLLFIVDASGSMGAKGRMVASKGAIMSLLKDAYLKRDRVAMVSFRKQQAVVNLPPTSSIHRAGELLKELPVGGKTPLAAGLRKGQGLLRNVLLKDPECRPILIVITDGKANESVGNGDPFWEALSAARELASDKRLRSIVVDAEEEGGFLYGHSARLAEVLHAEYFKIKDLRADVLLEIVRTGN